MSQYLKVGRLLPGENGDIQIMKNGFGEIGAVNGVDVILTCGRLELIRQYLINYLQNIMKKK